MNQDDDHLQLLAVFHYILAGFVALLSLFPTLHLLLGIGMVIVSFTELKVLFPLQIIGWFFIIFASFWITCGLTFASCLAVAGRSLQRRRRYLFCLVMAGMACILMPFGTILGVFTIVMLTKESVKNQFHGATVPALDGDSTPTFSEVSHGP